MSLKYKFKNPDGTYFVTFSVVGWIDVFTREEYRTIFIDSLNWCIKNKGLVVHGWVLMTNHVHLIVSRKGEKNLQEIFRDMKKFTFIKIMEEIRKSTTESRKDWMLKIFREKGQANPQNENNQFWQHGSHPVELFDRNMMEQKLEYIHNNPVKQGFTNCQESYNWSSAVDCSGLKGYVDIEKLV